MPDDELENARIPDNRLLECCRMCVPPEAQWSFFKSIIPSQDVVCSYLFPITIVCEGGKQLLVLLATTSNITLKPSSEL